MVDGKEENNIIEISDSDFGEITDRGEDSVIQLLEDCSERNKDAGEVLEQQNESLSLEEGQSASGIVSGKNATQEAQKEPISEIKVKVVKKKKTPEVEWKLVVRTRRKTKFFSFCEVFGGKVEVETWALAGSQQVSWIICFVFSSIPPCRFRACWEPGGRHWWCLAWSMGWGRERASCWRLRPRRGRSTWSTWRTTPSTPSSATLATSLRRRWWRLPA